MYKLFTDKSELFECDIKIQGASLKKSEARLVVETKDYSLLFNGSIDSTGKCKIPIRKLGGLIDEDSNGSIKLEVIAEDTFFTPWKSKFEVQKSKMVTVEVKSQDNREIIQEDRIQVSNVKNEVTKKETDHVVNLLKLLVRENINPDNLHVKRSRVNKIVATYTKHKPIEENNRKEVIKEALKGLYKK